VFCPNCGTQNPDSAQTCSKCNFHLKGAAAPKFKGTMLMMNQPVLPTPAPGAAAPTAGTTGAPPPAGPAPGGPPRAGGPAGISSKLKGTMVGVAPMAGAMGNAPPVAVPPAPACCEHAAAESNTARSKLRPRSIQGWCSRPGTGSTRAKDGRTHGVSASRRKAGAVAPGKLRFGSFSLCADADRRVERHWPVGARPGRDLRRFNQPDGGVSLHLLLVLRADGHLSLVRGAHVAGCRAGFHPRGIGRRRPELEGLGVKRRKGARRDCLPASNRPCGLDPMDRATSPCPGAIHPAPCKDMVMPVTNLIRAMRR